MEIKAKDVNQAVLGSGTGDRICWLYGFEFVH